MASVNVNIIGTVKFFDQAKGFGIIVTKLGDVFIHVSKASGKQAELVADAEVRVDFFTTYKDGQYKHAATALLSVKALPAPVEVLDVVKFYSSEKNFGFIHCGGAGFSKDEAILRGNVANRAGIVPGKGMPVRAIVVEEPKGPVVISFQWGPQVEADYAAANPEPTEVGVLKYFDPKGFGFLVREDGSQIGFHIMGAAEGLRDDFKKKYRKGSTFAFVVGDYRGKETALIRELLALAPERDAESGEGAETVESVEVVAVEAIAPVEDAVYAPVAECEAKPAKAPRKNAAAKTGAKPKGKVTGKSGGIPSAKDYDAYHKDQSVDIASMAAHKCANGGGTIALAMLAAAVPAGNA